MLKRVFSVFLALVLALSLVSGCKTPARKPAPKTPPQTTAPKTTPRTSALFYPPVATPPSIGKTTYKGNAFEVKVVQLVNVERQKVGHDPLTEDKLLDKGATTKAADMRDKGYFKHSSPTYGSPFVMMKNLGVKYNAAGENIASGYKTPEAVVAGWMRSPGHRANILSTKYHKIGVGYAKGGWSGAYWVQWFTN